MFYAFSALTYVTFSFFFCRYLTCRHSSDFRQILLFNYFVWILIFHKSEWADIRHRCAATMKWFALWKMTLRYLENSSRWIKFSLYIAHEVNEICFGFFANFEGNTFDLKRIDWGENDWEKLFFYSANLFEWKWTVDFLLTRANQCKMLHFYNRHCRFDTTAQGFYANCSSFFKIQGSHRLTTVFSLR